MNEENKKFIDRIKKVESGCWEWTGHIHVSGYGEFYTNGKRIRAHRYSCELFKKKIPFGKVIDHLCRNRKCVNPDHLEIVSIYENSTRGEGVGAKALRMTSCAKGHEFNEINTWYRPVKNSSRFWRVCRICRRNKMRDIRKKRKELLK